MARRTLNLGILAHVDAGKTTLTERLLHAAGVIDTVGSVDEGTTRTDTLALERARGITIKAAVVSFDIGDVTVNLIDTPGHPDFIAEVDRVLSLLDGAVLVLSAVEGVQPQTRVLLRALRRLRVPTLLFVNKIDRRGADEGRVLAAIAARLTDGCVPMGTVEEMGSPAARIQPYPRRHGAIVEAVAERDDATLADYVHGRPVEPTRALRRLTRRGQLHPAFFGSAVTGEGVSELMSALAELLPARAADPAAEPAGRVFKIERGPGGEKIAYLRMFAGTVHMRQRLLVGGVEAKPTAIRVSHRGGWEPRPAARAGEIAKLWGLPRVRIGDTIGVSPTSAEAGIPPPTMQAVVEAVHARDGGALRAALARLAEEDPLITVDDSGRLVTVSLYGEVQQEVIGATLADELGIPVRFREATTRCVERPVGMGEAVVLLHAEGNPGSAELGLRVSPAGPGITVSVDVPPQAMPLHVYKNVEGFTAAMNNYVRHGLRTGLHGWPVTDCEIVIVHSGYGGSDGPPSRRAPDPTAADFRDLTTIVLGRALRRAGTVVCEPMLRVTLEVPVASASTVLTALGRLGAAVRDHAVRGELTTVAATLPAARLRQLQRSLAALTSGDGVLESTFEGYRPVLGRRAEDLRRPTRHA